MEETRDWQMYYLHAVARIDTEQRSRPSWTHRLSGCGNVAGVPLEDHDEGYSGIRHYAGVDLNDEDLAMDASTRPPVGPGAGGMLNWFAIQCCNA